MRILTRMLSTGLLAGAAAVAFAALPPAALAEGGPPTKNIVDPPGPRAADWHTPGSLIRDEGDPPGPLVGDEGEPPGTLTADGPTPFPSATNGTPQPLPALLEPPGPH